MTLRVEYRIKSAEPVPSSSFSPTPATSGTPRSWLSRWAAPLLLFLVGCLALGYYVYDILDAHFFQDDQSRQFDQALRDAHDKSASAIATNQNPADELHAEAIADLKADSSRRSTSPVLPNFEESAGTSHSTHPEERVAENTPLGRIEIGSIGLSAMIQEGTGARALRRGVGHISGTALLGLSGNVGLAAHRDTFFRKLRNVHEGDEIKLTTLKGTAIYHVEVISIVEPEQSDVLRDSGENMLTLVTCYPYSYIGPAPKRFIVRARQTPSPVATEIN